MTGSLREEALTAWLLPPGALEAGPEPLLRLILRRLGGQAAIVAAVGSEDLRPLASLGLTRDPAAPPPALLAALWAAPEGFLCCPDFPEGTGDAAWMGAPDQVLLAAALVAGRTHRQVLLAVAAPEPNPVAGDVRTEVADLLTLAREVGRLQASLRASVRDLEEGLITATGEAFYPWLTRYVVSTLQVRCAFIGELVGPHWDAVQVLSMHLDGEEVPPFRYALAGTPCERVVGREPCLVPEAVQRRFPEDTFLAEHGMECYAGVPLFDSQGEALGLLAALDGGPSLGGQQEQVLRLLERLAARAAAELERRRALEELEALVEATARPVQAERLDALVRSVARGLRARGAWLAARTPGSTSSLRTLACCWDAATLHIPDRPLANSPWDPPSGREHLLLGPEELAACGPEPVLQGGLVQAVALELLRNSRGEVVGHLAVLHDGTLQAKIFERMSFRAVASLAAAELERQREEERRLRAECRALETQKLESLGSFAGGLAHDFNNLLVGILGNLNLACQDLPEGGGVRRLVEDAEHAAQRAADLARQLLAYSGRGRFVVVPLDLDALLEDLVGLLQAALPRGTELRLELEPGLPPILADASLLRQAVLNLVRNAGEALVGGEGIIRVATGRVHLDDGMVRELALRSGMAPGEHLFVEVADTGAGMDEATRSRIFEPFFSTRAAGRGLGLAAVQGIARGHRGGIGIRTTPGAGSTVRLYLPVEAVLPEAAEAAAARVAPGKAPRARVLVVDDEASVRAVASRMLHRLGLEAEAVADGEEGLTRYLEDPGRFDLVLLDLTMPRLDGEQTLRRLRERDPEVRVLLMSGYSAEEAAERFRDLGPLTFLHKPFRLSDLRARLEEVLGGSL